MGKDFLTGITNWNNHRPLLWLALEITRGDVLELGMGDGSTPYLMDYCERNNRKLVSYDNNKIYVDKFNFGTLVDEWDDIDINKKWSVVLVDHAPAEQRHVDAILLKNLAEIVIVHDAEHEGLLYDVYSIKKITDNFKYRLDLSIPQHPAKAIMLSNTIDVSKLTIPKFDFE